MKTSALLTLASSAVLAAAHGTVSDMKIGSTWVGGYNPYQDPYMNPVPERIVWAFPNGGNGPVEDVTSADITCNKAATAAPISANVAAGADISFFWTVWPESHKGPVMTYMAACGSDDCSTADPASLSFFKIDEAGYTDGTWASDTLIANNNSHTVTVPSDIKPGGYIIRHELLALHSAGTAGGAQFYPMCANLVVDGSGSAEPEGVKFPGAYAESDPGITVDIYNGLTEYTIPGPAVYGGGASSGSGNSSSAAPVASSAAATSAAATSAAASVAPVESSAAAETTVVAPAATTAPAAIIISSAVPTTLQTMTRPAASTGVFPPSGSQPTGTGVAVPIGTAPAASAPAASAPAPSGTATTGGQGGYGKTPQGINKCLDAVNACIAKAQRQRGSGFKNCESRRAACY
ncbi:putative endoglucanase/cellulase [Geopyxis carbonaria]|nr:putative endoglucanase/cellulase [Geopyxis carbonaria]